jgi:hypothetical protein
MIVLISLGYEGTKNNACNIKIGAGHVVNTEELPGIFFLTFYFCLAQ